MKNISISINLAPVLMVIVLCISLAVNPNATMDLVKELLAFISGLVPWF